MLCYTYISNRICIQYAALTFETFDLEKLRVNDLQKVIISECISMCYVVLYYEALFGC